MVQDYVFASDALEFSPELLNKWLPIGGVIGDILHLFWSGLSDLRSHPILTDHRIKRFTVIRSIGSGFGTRSSNPSRVKR